jgi:hypothetical protein
VINKRDPSGLCEQYLPDVACWSLAERLALEGGIQQPGTDGYEARDRHTGRLIGLEAANYGYVALQSLPQMFVFVAEVPGARQGGYYLPYNEDEAYVIQNFQRR